MDGHCYQCAEKFGFFKKEHGCKKCGHSFCKTCLPYKAVIPGRGSSTEEQVCKECFTFLKASPQEQKQNKQNEGKYSPPENYKKRVAAYNAKQETQENKSKASKSASVSSPAGPNAKRYKGLSEADRDLAQRLDRLKEERKKMRGRVASVEEMEDRLRTLKGLPQKGASSSTSQQPTVYQPPDTRTSYQQSDDLMTEMKEEAAIDARVAGQDVEGESKDVEIPSEPEMQNLEDEAKRLIQEARGALKQEEEGAKKDDEMAARVAKLKGIDPALATDTGTKDEEEVSEEEASKRLITQLMEEAKLEDKVKEDGFGDTSSRPTAAADSVENKPKVDPDELPWCCICNEDASLRCHGCDEDLYCARCFREGHDQFDLPDHKTVPYKPPKNQGR
ncbi:abscission/NoCut checkpoint regulator-like [Amphiura filiformis]|uniref:abscission/NoCut checkpoint regulator-like n=1 Tax=Amphiura filiformis TaxID=82378 RepID=UPI003B20B9F8